MWLLRKEDFMQDVTVSAHKTVWERCFRKAIATESAGTVQTAEYSFDAKITRTHNINRDGDGDPVMTQYYEFIFAGTRPPELLAIPHPTEPLTTREQAETASQIFTKRHELTGWTVDPVCAVDDWD
jgi:hypothetical protein